MSGETGTYLIKPGNSSGKKAEEKPEFSRLLALHIQNGMRKNRLTARKWSQRKLAAAAAGEYNADADRAKETFSDRTIRNWLAGNNPPSENIFNALCRVFFTPGSPEEITFRSAWLLFGVPGVAAQPEISIELPPTPPQKKFSISDADLPWPDLIDLSVGVRQPDQPDHFRLFVSLSLGRTKETLDGDWLSIGLRKLTLRLEAPDHTRTQRFTAADITQHGVSWRFQVPETAAANDPSSSTTEDDTLERRDRAVLSGRPASMTENDPLVTLQPRASVEAPRAPIVKAYIHGPEDVDVELVRGDTGSAPPRANEAVIAIFARKKVETDPNGIEIGSSWVIWKDLP